MYLIMRGILFYVEIKKYEYAAVVFCKIVRGRVGVSSLCN